jgi:hypothetical protein
MFASIVVVLGLFLTVFITLMALNQGALDT